MSGNKYDYISEIFNGVALVYNEDESGVVDINTGEEIIPFGRFDDIWKISDCGYAVIEHDDLMGIVRLFG